MLHIFHAACQGNFPPKPTQPGAGVLTASLVMAWRQSHRHPLANSAGSPGPHTAGSARGLRGWGAGAEKALAPSRSRARPRQKRAQLCPPRHLPLCPVPREGLPVLRQGLGRSHIPGVEPPRSFAPRDSLRWRPAGLASQESRWEPGGPGLSASKPRIGVRSLFWSREAALSQASRGL